MMHVTVSDGVKIAVYDMNPDGKETIVMIHGWPLSEKIFEYQKELLINCGYRVITMDIRGFGNSDTPAFGYSYDRIATDIYTIVCCLNLKNFVLAGFSMGGAITMRYMGKFNGYGVKKLVLMGAAGPCYTQRPGFPYGVTKESVNKLIEQASNDRPQLCTNFSGMLFASPHSKSLINWFKDIGLSASGTGTIQTAYSLRDEDCRADMKDIKVPTGIFHGRKDRIVPFQLALIQKQVIQNSILYPFENSGHGVFYDELELFNQRLLQFLSL